MGPSRLMANQRLWSMQREQNVWKRSTLEAMSKADRPVKNEFA